MAATELERTKNTMPMGRFGRYLVLARWAGGGMADIYVARQRGTEGFDKLVALKLMRQDVADDPEFREMFFSEARTSALLSHPGIVQTFDAGEIQGRVYMAMEFVNGEPVNRLLRAIRDRELMPVPLSVEIIREVALALDYAHSLRDLHGRPLELVHRDVSPSNIMLSHEGSVKLLDFGVAKVATRAQSTRAGILKGKTSYMAPEHLLGERVDARTDVYALGLVLWELLTGKRAIRGGDQAELIRSVVESKFVAPSAAGATIDGELDAVVLRALAREPSERWQSARDFAEALGAWAVKRAPGFRAAVAIRDIMQRYFPERADRLRELVAASQKVNTGEYEVLVEEPEDWDILSLTPPSDRKSATPVSSSIKITHSRRSAELGLADPAVTLAAEPVATTPRRRPLLLVSAAAAVLAGALAAWALWPSEAAPSRVRLTTEPPGATVRLDGQAVGHTPYLLDVGAHGANVTLERRGYQPWHDTFSRGRAPETRHVILTRADVFGTLSIESDPPGAQVVVDGVPQAGTTPMVVARLWVGEPHAIVVSAAGREPGSATVEFGEELSRSVRVALAARGGEPAVGSSAVAVAAPPTEAPIAGEAADRTEQRRGGAGARAARLDPVAATVAANLLTEPAPQPIASEPASAPAPSVGAPAPRVAPGPRVTPTPRVEPAPAPAPAPSPAPVRLTPRAAVGTPAIDGLIDRGSVRSALRGTSGALTNCYAQAYGQGAFEGSVTIRFRLDDAGRVRGLAVGGSAASRVSSCVSRVISGAHFPSSTAQDASVSVPVELRAR